MADLSINFVGIRSPNPFWLASAPPTNSGAQIHRAFEHGWGGAVWKTIGPPVLNISNRYGGLSLGGQRLLAINNVELISDRPRCCDGAANRPGRRPSDAHDAHAWRWGVREELHVSSCLP